MKYIGTALMKYSHISVENHEYAETLVYHTVEQKLFVITLYYVYGCWEFDEKTTPIIHLMCGATDNQATKQSV